MKYIYCQNGVAVDKCGANEEGMEQWDMHTFERFVG